MAVEHPNRVAAACLFQIEAGPVATLVLGNGISAVVRNGVGDYTITLEQGLTEPQSTWHVGVREDPPATLTAMSDAGVANPETERQILTTDQAGVPTDPAVGDFVEVTIYAAPTEVGA